MNPLKSILSKIPIVNSLLAYRYKRQFEANRFGQLYRGVFDSFEAAAASAPTDVDGYDCEPAANMYDDLMANVQSYDWPVLYWLKSVAAKSVFDVGGHKGIKYYAFERLLPTVDTWTVYDRPAVLEVGRRLAAQKASPVTFTNNFSDAALARDAMLCLGSLQYIKQSLAELLGDSIRPRVIILNTTPFTANKEEAFYTLNSFGTSFAPYKVQNLTEFILAMQGVGYEVQESWENPARSNHVPWQNKRSDFEYRGMILKHTGA